jgi:hypothetical protein
VQRAFVAETVTNMKRGGDGSNQYKRAKLPIGRLADSGEPTISVAEAAKKFDVAERTLVSANWQIPLLNLPFLSHLHLGELPTTFAAVDHPRIPEEPERTAKALAGCAAGQGGQLLHGLLPIAVFLVGSGFGLMNGRARLFGWSSRGRFIFSRGRPHDAERGRLAADVNGLFLLIGAVLGQRFGQERVNADESYRGIAPVQHLLAKAAGFFDRSRSRAEGDKRTARGRDVSSSRGAGLRRRMTQRQGRRRETTGHRRTAEALGYLVLSGDGENENFMEEK